MNIIQLNHNKKFLNNIFKKTKHQNLEPIGFAVLTFIEYKQTNKQKQTSKVSLNFKEINYKMFIK